MLPHAPNIGISETFGTATVGDAKFSDIDGGSITLDFLTTHSDVPRRLAVVNSSNRKLWSPKLLNTPNNDHANPNKDETLDNKLIKRNSKWVSQKKPEGTVHNLNHYSQSLELGSQLFDPTLASVCKVFKVDTRVISVTTVGKNNNILALGKIDPQWEGWKLMEKCENVSTLQSDDESTSYSGTSRGFDTSDSEEFVADNNSRNLKSPKFVWLKSLTLKSRILGIDTFDLDDKSQSAVLILVRTSDTIYLLKCAILNSLFSLIKVFDFKRSLSWAPFAHSSVLITSSSVMLCIVDSLGKFAIFKSSNAAYLEFVQIKLKYGSFYDPVELSNFKKSMWIDSKRLILFSRTQLFEYTFGSSLDNETPKEKFFCRICAGIWSKILDIKQSAQKSYLFYMLTTKELILVNTSNGFTRKFAWKHYFSDLDTTMSLSIIKTPQSSSKELCIISSKASVVNYVIEVNTREFKVVDSPYIFVIDLRQPSVSTEIYQLGEKCCLHLVLQKFENGEALFSLLNFTSCYNNRTRYGQISQQHCCSKNSQVTMKYCSRLPVERSVFPLLYQELSTYYKFDVKDPADPSEVTNKIYDALKNFLDEENISHKSLFQMMDNIHIPRNVKNIFKIVKHLISNSDETDFGFTLNEFCWLSDKSTSAGNTEANIESIGSHIIDFFQSLVGKHYKSITPDITLQLLLGLISLGKNESTLNQKDVEKQVKKTRSRLPDDYQDMLKSFDDDASVIGIMDLKSSDFSHSSIDPPRDTQSNVPIISTSQTPQVSLSQLKVLDKTHTLKLPKPKKVDTKSIHSFVSNPVSNSQQFSQMSQKSSQLSSVGFSQSQARGPKRKKRRTGF